MVRSLLAFLLLALLPAPLSVAQEGDPHLEKGQFCTQQKAGVDRRASEESAAIFASLHACGTFCTDAGYLKETESEQRINDLISRCEAAFSELPGDIQSRFGAAPDVADMTAATEMRDMANECRSLALQYPRLAHDRRDYSFNRCTMACDNAADRIEEAGYDIGDFSASCEEHYTGAKARIAGGTRSR